MTLIMTILGVFGSALGGAASWIISFFQAEQAAQTQANSNEQSAEQQQSQQGAQSVADRDSSDQQNSDLDAIQQQLDNPTQAVVTQPKPVIPTPSAQNITGKS